MPAWTRPHRRTPSALWAAESDGRLSTAFCACLDQAREVYIRGIAPLIITLGSTTKDESSAGAVGSDYPMSLRIPENAIIAETESGNTEELAYRFAV